MSNGTGETNRAELEAAIEIFGWFFMIIFAGAFLRGVALAYLWGWFVVPLGAPPIPWMHAQGLGVIIAMMSAYRPLDNKKEGEKSTVESVANMRQATFYVFAVPVLATIMGYIWHSLMP